jgi:hypothetical protein
MIQRIETGTTGKGVPDLYLRYHTRELWVELKNMPRDSIYAGQFEIPWRAGQQSWHLDYYRACKSPVTTVVAMRDGFLLIPLYKRFVKNVVKLNAVYSCTRLHDVVRILGHLGGANGD